MKIELDLIENKNPCTVGDLSRRINKNLEDQGLIEQISYIRRPKLVFDLPKKHINLSQLYSVIISAGYSIKDSIISQGGVSENKTLLAEDYARTKARFNPEKTRGQMISKHGSKLTNAEGEK